VLLVFGARSGDAWRQVALEFVTPFQRALSSGSNACVSTFGLHLELDIREHFLNRLFDLGGVVALLSLQIAPGDHGRYFTLAHVYGYATRPLPLSLSMPPRPFGRGSSLTPMSCSYRLHLDVHPISDDGFSGL
jgi:hypothetical protein